MKLKLRPILVIFSIFLVFLSCTAKPKIFFDDGTFIYHTGKHKPYKSNEKIAVFADSNGCFHIFDNFGKSEIKTFSESRFVRELSYLSSKYHLARIAVLNFSGAENGKITDLLNNTNLFQSVEYNFSSNSRFATARTLEDQTVLNFYYES